MFVSLGFEKSGRALTTCGGAWQCLDSTSWLRGSQHPFYKHAPAMGVHALDIDSKSLTRWAPISGT